PRPSTSEGRGAGGEGRRAERQVFKKISHAKPRRTRSSASSSARSAIQTSVAPSSRKAVRGTFAFFAASLDPSLLQASRRVTPPTLTPNPSPFRSGRARGDFGENRKVYGALRKVVTVFFHQETEKRRHPEALHEVHLVQPDAVALSA